MALISFFKSNFLHIKQGGFSVFYSKAKKAPKRIILIIFDFLALPFSILIVLLIRILKPIVHIRFGYFYGGRIGHFVPDTVCAAIGDNKYSEFIDLYYFLPGEKNLQWAKMVKSELNIYFWVRLLFFANNLLPGGSAHTIIPDVDKRIGSQGRLRQGLLYDSDFRFKFKESDEVIAKSWLIKKGWSEGEKIICVMVRDDAFLSTKNWEYHSYRDSDISTFVPAMELLASMGYWVIRMGKTMKNPLKLNNSHIIDYAFDKEKSDLLDVWLFANCELCITTGTGPDLISMMYKRPVLAINYIPLGALFSWGEALTAPKNLYWKETGLTLSWKEHLENSFHHTKSYEDAGIEIKELNSEEILDIVNEMISRINKKFIDFDEDSKVQNQFWKIGKQSEHFNLLEPSSQLEYDFIHPDSRISLSYVRNNLDWLKH
jgi:putative glycosyltransferase (TIGR04372 family)